MEILQWLHLSVCACKCAQHMHTSCDYRCTCVISMRLEVRFHASVALIVSTHGGRAPLWHELVHDIAESVLLGSIDACFQGHRGVVCPSCRLGNTWPSQRWSLLESPNFALESRSTCEAICQVEWEETIKDINTKQCKHIIKEKEILFF